jgi:glycosyltransferase involved in cell wall biosynthesis
MTRALVIEAAGNLRGSERALIDFVEGTSELEFAVCCPPRTPLCRELQKRHIRQLPYFVFGLHQKSRWRRLQAAIGVIRACLEFRPHVIHVNQGGAYKVTFPAAWLLNLPIVAHVRLFEEVAYLAEQRPDPRCLRGLIASSGAVEAEIRRFPALASVPLHRLYDAYRRVSPATADLAEGRAMRRLVCAGRVEHMKGQDLLVGALGLLKNDCTECLVAGDGDPAFIDELRQVAAAKSVSSIQWLGLVDDILPLLRTSWVLAFPSHRETLGRVILEAWDAGAIPVVFSGSGGAAEIVAAADGGILYDEQTPQSLAMALRKALELDGEGRNKLVHNGRLWMSTNCNSEAYGETISKILRNAASKCYTLGGLG